MAECCHACSTVHPSDAAVAVGRFDPHGVRGYRSRLGGPLRPTRSEVEADYCTARQSDGPHVFTKGGESALVIPCAGDGCPHCVPQQSAERCDRCAKPAVWSDDLNMVLLCEDHAPRENAEPAS